MNSVRHVLDTFLSALLLVALFPIFVTIAAIIVLDSGSPIFFTQSRVGRGGESFQLLKFRTMRASQNGPSVTARGDSRITGIGRILRKFKLDELPQLWNVIRGDMSLIGPRPEVPEFVDLNQPVWRSVLQVRPGITDPASITYRNEEELLAQSSNPILYYKEFVLPAKLALNLEYLKNRSFWSDVKVILQTAKCALLPGTFKIKSIRVATPEEDSK